jgi:hypothetical protein
MEGIKIGSVPVAEIAIAHHNRLRFASARAHRFVQCSGFFVGSRRSFPRAFISAKSVP